MRHQHKIQIAWYVLSDFITASLSWALFFIFRKYLLDEPFHIMQEVFTDSKFWMGIVLIPAGWILLHALFGTYVSLYTKSRLNELILSFFTTLIGSMILFFLFVLDDGNKDYRYYYEAFFLIWGLSFIFQFSGRLTLLTIAKKQVISGKVWFDTLIIGNDVTARKIYVDLRKNHQWLGYRFAGYLSVPGEKDQFNQELSSLGSLDGLEHCMDKTAY